MADPIVKGILEFSLSSTRGTFEFTGFEVPPMLDSLGSDLKSVVHTFPGGSRDGQTFGTTPPDEIHWDGIIFGFDSFSRFNQLQAMANFQGLTTLVYGPFKLQGLLASIKGKPGYQGYVPYHAVFKPLQDLTLIAVQLTPSQTQATVISQGLFLSSTAATAATAAAPDLPNVDDQLAVQQQATGLLTAVAAVDLSNPAASVTAFTAATVGMMLYLQTATDMDAAALSLAMYIQAGQVLAVLGAATAPRNIFLSIDSPNLLLLAARYYNDADQWTTISAANGGLPPFNTGAFNLAIPLDS